MTYNARIRQLERIWARADIRVQGVDDEGRAFDNQVEGHLQLIRPDRVALSIAKLGEVYFYLGSNSERYWWLDLSGSPRTARVGTHGGSGAADVLSRDLPLQPLDLIELLGVTPLPVDLGSSNQGDGASLSDVGARAPARSHGLTFLTADARTIVVAVQSAGRRQWLYLDASTLEPKRIQLAGGATRDLIDATLTDYLPVRVRENPAASPRMASVVTVRLPSQQTEVRFRFNSMENRGESMKNAPFDLERLLTSYRVDSIVDLDAGRRSGRPQTQPGGSAP
ncbi:MAG: hypothetical protein SFZ23_01095 [Planctomycetota bacterium]|nr:hypothetical protein [Planctomycetota bacterium]